MEKKCVICGRNFESPYPITKYCSCECRKEGYKRWRRQYMKKYWKEHIEQYEKQKTRNKKKPRKLGVGGYVKKKFFEYSEEEQNKIIELAKIQQPRQQPIFAKYIKCAVCNSTKGLISHHITYRPEKKIIVCRSCHNYIHILTTKKHRIDILNGKRFITFVEN